MTALQLSVVENAGQLDIGSHRGLFDYWSRLRGAADIPCYDAIDVLQIERALLPWLLLAELDRGRDDYYYRVVGTGIDEHNGFFATGQYLAELPLSNKADMRKIFDQVVATRQPHYCASRYLGVHRNYKLARRLLLPLCERGDDPAVRYIICAVDFVAAAD